MRFRLHQRFRRLLLIFTILCTGTYMYIARFSSPFTYKIFKEQKVETFPNFDTKDTEIVQCIQPKLKPFAPEVLKYLHTADPVVCANDSDWISVLNGTVFIKPEAIEKHGRINCDIIFYDRISDYKNRDKEINKLNSTIPIKLKWDFLKAKCNASDGKTYDNTHAGIRYVKKLHEKTENASSGLGLDVLILGFDSLSHMTYIRKLKKTYEYFTKTLQGLVLNGYNIVGDGTPQALIPIFTGKTELELPPTQRNNPNKQFVDVYPLIWKDFRNRGYVTAWSEDSPHMGTFTYRMTGFNETPTDHYMRPFHITAHYEYEPKNKKSCLGSTKRSAVFMNWIRDFFMMYDKKMKFVFGFHSELSHVDNNLVESADDDLYNLLKFLYEGNYLRNTLVILMSDHGARFNKFRSTLQGKQEERLPFFGFAFPNWFKSKYSEAYSNLFTNTNRLVTPFDIYPTLRDILDYSGPGTGDISDRGISLLKEIPNYRTCHHARIDLHWCTCLKWQTLENNQTDVVNAANYIVKTINEITFIERKLCSRLQLNKVVGAQLLSPEKNLLMFRKSKDAEGRVADMSDNTKLSENVYQITLFTTPGNGLFEVTVTLDVINNSFRVDKSSISRLNKYGDAPKCIENDHEELRKYCYCY